MRLKYFKNKIIPLLLILLLLFQSCSVYQKNPVALDEASKSGLRVRIEKEGQKSHDFKKIEYKDGTYYGVKKVNKEMVSTPLDEKDIKLVRVLDKNKSGLATGGFIVVSVLLVAAFIFLATYDLGSIGGFGG